MSKGFDPMESGRVPREEGFQEETEQIFEYLRSRGDQRIGQYLLNVVKHRVEEKGLQMYRGFEKMDTHEVAERVLWEIEASELLEAIEEFENSVRRDVENGDTE